MFGLNGKGYFRGNYYSIVLYRLAIAFLLLWLSRVLFYVFNTHYFGHLTAGEVVRLFFFGIRFDLSSLVALNTPFLLMMTMPHPWRALKAYRNVAGAFFYVANFVGLGLNMADIVYFRFTQKRMTGDIFQFVAKDIEMNLLLPQFIRDFWGYFLLFFLLAALLVWLSQKVAFSKRRYTERILRYYRFQLLAFILMCVTAVVTFRGGFQLKPIKIITAAKYTLPQNVPVILNTPFTILRTLDQEVLHKVTYYDEEELQMIYNPVFRPSDTSDSDSLPAFRPSNVVVIVMESLSGEHIGAFNRDIEDYSGFTPFLDSLIAHSLVYNGFANAKQSIEGLPAAAASLPSLMNRPYINSAYTGNSINSLASLLSKKSYHTSFFHGGTNGTMDFDRFADLAGFHEYYGRSEYDNDADFDGRWGIFDEPFFRYFAENLNKTPQPFFSMILSLSAHHPYTIPEKHKDRFRSGNLAIQEALMYADFALERFFETASEMSWFDSTLFVITADHTSEAYLPQYKTRYGMFKIPVIFFHPSGNLNGNPEATAAQVDILPSVLGWLNYDLPFLAFGENLFDNEKPSFAVNFLNGIYQIVQTPYALEFDGEKSRALYHTKNDPLMRNNLLSIEPARALEMEILLKAYIQQYNNRLIENRMTVE
jgi:phosphoglycerol transferase MdoB-like AlkP superfamily enzyme